MCWSVVWEAIAALGTVLAVIVALWLARGDRRQRQLDAAASAKEVELRGSLFAASMAYRLSHTQSELSSCVARVEFGTNMEDSDEVLLALKEFKKVVEGPIFLPTPDELLPLVALGESCAHRIARAVDLISAVRGRATSYDLESLSLPQRRGFLKAWTTIFTSASELIGVALLTCEGVSQRDAPDLSLEERYGPDYDEE